MKSKKKKKKLIVNDGVDKSSTSESINGDNISDKDAVSVVAEESQHNLADNKRVPSDSGAVCGDNPKTYAIKSGILSKVYSIRYFIIHLVKWDMKYKFRRSKLGMLWTVLQPLFLALTIAFVFGAVFNVPILGYTPYILAGFIGWDLIYAGVVINSFAYIKAESYIRQYSHPVVIYPLRETLVSLCTFLIALVALAIWVFFINPYNLIVAVLSLPLTLIMFFALIFPISIISAHMHIRFRDYPYIFGIVMQALWYISPVFFWESMFKNNEYLYSWFLYNPVTSILKLIRDPFLEGQFPSLFAYGYVFVLIIIFNVIAYFVDKKCRRNVIFYL